MTNPSQHTEKTISGLKWTGVNQVIKQALNIGIGILLARILNPNDFGLLGMVTVITGFIQLFNDFGFGAALIQKQDTTENDFHSVFWFNLLTGLVFCLTLQLTSSFIAHFYGRPEINQIIKAVSFIFIIQALGYVQYTLFRKQLNFKAIFLAESIAMFGSGAIALYMALNGYGVWSLVTQLLANATIILVILWFVSIWRPKIIFSWQRIIYLLRFSIPLMGSTALNYTLGNVDKILIGRFLGANSLGIYTRSYTLMVFPVQQISGVISQVMFPAFAQIQNDKERIKNIYLRMNRVISAVTFPLMGFAFVFADSIVLILLGEQWREMIPIFKVLTVVGALQSIGTLVGNIFMALGKMKLYLQVNLFSGIIFTTASIIGVQFGLTGVTLALAVATLLVALPQWYITGNLITLSLINYVQAWFLSFVLVIGLVALFTLFFKTTVLIESLIVSVSIGFVIFFGIYILLQKTINPIVVKEFLTLKK